MENTHQKHLLILITNPFAIINMIHSGLVAELSRHYRISIMSDLLTESDMAHLNRHFRMQTEWLGTPLPQISRTMKWLRAVQMLLFGHFFDIRTTCMKLRERGAVLHRLFRITRRILWLNSLSRLLVVLIRKWLIRRTTLSGLFNEIAVHHIEAVISTSPLDLRENAVINSLYKHGISCMSIIISWDNLTSKGVMNAPSDRVMVWNEAMAAEYERFYSIFDGNQAKVHVAGIPRFDTYFQDAPAHCFHLYHQLKIKLTQQIILFSTGAVKHHSCQQYIIRDLLEYAESRKDIVILVRCHPGDDLNRYKAFHGIHNLRFFQPFGGHQIPPTDFLQTLHGHLAICRVCVQVASTMLLDAVAAGKPCISIAYDAPRSESRVESLQRLYQYSHQQALPDGLKAHTVYSRHELFCKLDETMAHGRASKEGMAALESVIHRCAPDSVWLTTQCIREWLG